MKYLLRSLYILPLGLIVLLLELIGWGLKFLWHLRIPESNPFPDFIVLIKEEILQD
jgi:hypothetical protein